MYASSRRLRGVNGSGVALINKAGGMLEKPLIENTTKEQWDFIEGSAFNLRLAEVHKPEYGNLEGSFIGINERVTPKTLNVEPKEFEFRGKTRFGWVLNPGDWALLVSEEITNAPLFGFMPVKARFTFASAFSAMVSTDAQPNYQGRITTLLQVGPLPLRLAKGCDFCFVRLAYLTDEHSDAYKGVWGVEGYGITTGGEVTRAK